MATEPLRCAAALIVDDEGRIFVQRRSATRRLFPDCWDVVGGHLEPGESYEDALRREVREETGWEVAFVLGSLGETPYLGDDGQPRVEEDFLVRVDGDLSRPRLEAGKHTAFRWIGASDLDGLGLTDREGDRLIRELLVMGFAALHSLGQ
jgi:8-oxo-dGTP diphosphatase